MTGSTGLLGTNLVLDLLAAGHGVRALVRDREKANLVLPSHPRLTIVEGEVERLDRYRPSLEGVDAVVNGAAYFRESFGRGDHAAALRRTNVDAAVALYAAAHDLGLPRFVQVSSGGVLRRREDGAPSREEDAPGHRLRFNAYFRSKWEAEQALRLVLPTRLTLVRPGWMFGPHDSGPTGAGEMARQLALGKTVQLTRGTPMSVADARDVARTIRLVLESEEPPSVVNASGNPLSALEALRTFERLGYGKVQTVPFGMAMVLSQVLEVVTGLTGKENPIPHVGLLTLQNGIVEDTTRARALGATFRPFEETAHDTAEWFRSQSGAPALSG